MKDVRRSFLALFGVALVVAVVGRIGLAVMDLAGVLTYDYIAASTGTLLNQVCSALTGPALVAFMALGGMVCALAVAAPMLYGYWFQRRRAQARRLRAGARGGRGRDRGGPGVRPGVRKRHHVGRAAGLHEDEARLGRRHGAHGRDVFGRHRDAQRGRVRRDGDVRGARRTRPRQPGGRTCWWRLPCAAWWSWRSPCLPSPPSTWRTWTAWCAPGGWFSTRSRTWCCWAWPCGWRGQRARRKPNRQSRRKAGGAPGRQRRPKAGRDRLWQQVARLGKAGRRWNHRPPPGKAGRAACDGRRNRPGKQRERR